jgi:hypothetical protein
MTTKLEFFLGAASKNEYRRKAWVISAFSLINEGSDDWKKDPYPYRIVQTPSGHFYVDPDNIEHLLPIEDAVAGQPIFTVNEKVKIGVRHKIPNFFTHIKSTDPRFDVETTYGRLLFNYIVLVYPFGNKIPYINKQVNPSMLEELIIGRLKDDPEHGAHKNETDIYVSEYLVFCDAMFFLAGFTQICVPAATPKVLVAAPGINELKQKLIEENKGRLHDPAVIAKIDAELVKYDKEWMKGDPGEGFLLEGKSYNVVRKKLFGMHGAEAGLEEGIDVDLIQNSLAQGWDIAKFPAMNNSLRAGSFNRSTQTQLGGESVKWLLRASSNITVTKKDCGSRVGITTHVDNNNYHSLVGFHVIESRGTNHVTTEEAAKAYIGKEIMVRSPMFCQLDKTDYCETCVGSRLAASPTGLSSAITDYGSKFLLIFMKAMHGKQLVLAKMDYKTEIF